MHGSVVPLSKLVQGRRGELFDLPAVRSHVLKRVRENAKEVSAVWSDRVETLMRRHETALREQAETGRSLRAQLTKFAKKNVKVSAGEKRFQTLFSKQKQITTKVQDEKKHLSKRKAIELATAAISVDNLRRSKRKLEKDVFHLTNELSESKRKVQKSQSDCADVKNELYDLQARMTSILKTCRRDVLSPFRKEADVINKRLSRLRKAEQEAKLKVVILIVTCVLQTLTIFLIVRSDILYTR